MKKLAALSLLAVGLASTLFGSEAEERRARVMTWNVYIGADIAPLLLAPSIEALAQRADEAWQVMESTDFHARAAAIVDQIEKHQPHLIGLQEVSLLRYQSPGDRLYGGTEPATEVAFDYEAILLNEIAARGLDYRVVARVQNSDVEIPRANQTNDDVRLTNYDLTLARGDLTAQQVLAGNYQAALTLPTPDNLSLIRVDRGYTITEVSFGSDTGYFINTHLETDVFPALQEMQAKELLQILDELAGPAILVGDFNSAADHSTTASYGLIQEAGFVDTWPLSSTALEVPGFTCCQLADLSNPESILSSRIDIIFMRVPGEASNFLVNSWLVGDLSEHKTANGLWPSDHAGVVIEFKLP